MFGVSFWELLVLGTVALLVLGPEKLPGMLRTLGQWLAKLRRLTTEVRHQSGIDEVLRAEGFDGGLNELRGLMRGGAAALPAHHFTPRAPAAPPPHFAADKSREYPVEGPDAYGALPEDLLPKPVEVAPGHASATELSGPQQAADAPAEAGAPVATPRAQAGATEPGAGR